MTATRERQSAPSPDNGAPHWAERSAFRTRGVPLWAAVLIAAGGTALGAGLDLLISGTPGLIFKIGLFLGCVAGVALVRRESLFGPMVQPPLVATVVMPLLVLLFGGGGGSGMMGKALGVVQPIIAGFPMMAITTALCLAFGLARMFWLERHDAEDDLDPADQPTKKRKPVKPPKEAAERPARKRRPAEDEKRPSARSRDGSGRPRRPAEQGGRPRDAAAGKREPRPDRGTPPARGERGTPPARGVAGGAGGGGGGGGAPRAGARAGGGGGGVRGGGG
ncbi:DUF6542 domain-containing protein, partial [Saccharopolyspora sp. 6V]|uniref:DUF6542 domain-containing protein n=2 Tax=Saccharopolyspora TaxID=1835 RepID=UPI001CD674CB